MLAFIFFICALNYAVYPTAIQTMSSAITFMQRLQRNFADLAL